MGDYYRDNAVHLMSDSGQIGLIPESEVLRRLETTDFDEDPDMIDKHIRTLLVDFSPDSPMLASDQTRRSWDNNSGNFSYNVLNLRHFASRTPDDPYLPDGSFLDWQFMARDPRGIATGPDMREHMKQQYARAAFIKLSNDEDYSVPEQGINPVKMVSNIKSGMYQFKDRYKNFEESMDSWHNGGTVQGGRVYGTTVDNFTQDGTIKDLADAPQGNRRDAVAKLSSDPTIGFRYTVPDHRFTIAKYGLVRVSQDKNFQNWNNNRGSTFLDHANMSVINGELVNRQLAYLIADLQGQRNKKQAVAQGAQFNDSAVNQMMRKKLDPADIYKIQEIVGMNSGAITANQQIDGMSVARYGKTLKDNRAAMANTQINHHIAASMEQATKKLKDKNTIKDIRDSIDQSNADEGMYVTAKNKRPNHIKKSSNQTRHTKDIRHIEEQLTTKVYKGIKPIHKTKQKKNINGEEYAKESDLSIERSGKREGFDFVADPDYFDYEQDQGRLDFGVYDKADKAAAQDHAGRLLHYSVDNTGIEDSEQVREIESQLFNITS